MARKRSKHPTELELEILKILWDRHPQPVREVREALAAAGRPLAHTSLITTLNVMVDKGFATREAAGRGYDFTPVISHQDVSKGMLGDIVDRVFEGSSSALLLSLLENDQLDADEHAGLRAAIENYRNGGETHD
ncbi:MAG: BlaI family penicillinase repressor [Verrucomicrobiales bacterium]|jgi:BlaI family penicillinase repressor